MSRSTVITVLLGLTVLAGCGGNNPTPAASPAPAYKPPMLNEPADQPQAATAETEKPRESNDEPSQGQTTSLTTTEEMPAEEKDGLVDEAPSTQEPAATERTEEKESQEKKEEVEEPSGDENQSVTAAEPSAPRRRSGKLLRRLGSSFGRALAKAATTVESPSPSRAAPSLADDPFPNGEPVDDQAKN